MDIKNKKNDDKSSEDFPTEEDSYSETMDPETLEPDNVKNSQEVTPVSTQEPQGGAPPALPSQPVQEQPKPVPQTQQATAPQVPQQQQQAPAPQMAAQNQTAFPIQPINPQEMIANGAKTAADVANAHITPETYSDLFAKKSTLGKLGTLFGLMLSGAGSGLSHQSNALMDMMNKEIDRDLDAQKTSAANSQNLLKINQADELNKALIKLQAGQIGLIGAQTGLTQKQAISEEQRPKEISQQIAESKARIQNLVKQGVLTQSQADLVLAQADVAAKGQAKIDAMYLGMNDFVEQGKKLDPNSPEGQQYQQTLALLYPAVMKGVHTTATTTAAASSFLHASYNQSNSQQQAPQDNGSGVDMPRMQDMINRGRAPGAEGMPGVIPPSEALQLSTQAGAINQNRAAAQVFATQFNQMLPLVSQLKPGMAESSGRAMLKAQGFTNPSPEQIKEAARMLPTKEDLVSPGLVQKKFKDGISQFKNNEKNATDLQRYQLLKPFPEYSLKTKQSGPPDGTRAKSKSGQDIIAKGGKWYPISSPASSIPPKYGIAQGAD